ncbi:response regulator (plasmid) [Roseomonas sp. CCTCC AB2023176]|uniref:response regulator n=1 Tax=Roseomonas sp. CCTCC AB2023176 TaxID=3342640 RepID=UPI0035D9D935
MGPSYGKDFNEPAPRRILVVEDEIFIAMELESVLTEAGFGVIGPVPTVASALALLGSQRPDAAVLDVNLRGERVTSVAETLTAMGVPFILASAYGGADVASDAVLAGARNLGKPTQPATLLAALTDLLDRR